MDQEPGEGEDWELAAMKCTQCDAEFEFTSASVQEIAVCPQCGRTHVPLQDGSLAKKLPMRSVFDKPPDPAERPLEAVEFSINPYIAPQSNVSRPKRPPRKFDSQFWRGVGCLTGGIILSIISINFLLFGSGVMPMLVIALGPALILAGMIYLFFWYGD